MKPIGPTAESILASAAQSGPPEAVDSDVNGSRPAVSEPAESSLFPVPNSGSLPEPDGSLVALTQQLKQELVERFERGERPTAAEYLEKFPQIVEDRDRVVSLIYEEYCLHEEFDQQPTPEEFCRRYDAWRDSLASQLRYHRLLSSRADLLEPKAATQYPKPGEMFAGKFLLVSILGEGGTARVYLAEQPAMGNRRVALKVTRQLGKEPAIQGRLAHPHIVPVFSVDRDETTKLLGLCMPYRAGFPLDRVLKRIDPRAETATALSFWKAIQDPTEPATDDPSFLEGWLGFPSSGTYAEAAAWVALVIARALAYAHAQGTLHRDVKPANLLLTSNDGPQLLDFNLADSPEDADNAQQALQGGTLPYMAPEQLQAFLDPKRWNRVGASADVYSLGLVLVEMLTGRRPEAPREKIPLPRLINELLDLRARPHRSVREANPAIPHALAAIVAKCLSYETTDRYQSAEQLIADLEQFLDRRPLPYAVNPSRKERTTNWLHHRRQKLATAAGVVLMGGVLAFVWASTGPDPTLIRDAGISWLQKHPTIETAEDKAKLVQVRNDFERLAARFPDDYISLSNLGHIAKSFEHDHAKALRYYDRAIQIMRSKATLPKNQWVQVLLPEAAILFPMGHDAQEAGQTKVALEYYLRALSDLRAIQDDGLETYLPGKEVFVYQYLLACVEVQIAELHEKVDPLNARKHYTAALDVLEKLVNSAREAQASTLSDREAVDRSNAAPRFLEVALKLRSNIQATLDGIGFRLSSIKHSSY